jgi:two-component system heavy metal sensor histidine kinase CusS
MKARSIGVRVTTWSVMVVALATSALAAAGVWRARQSVMGAADATLRAQVDGIHQFIQTTSGRLSRADMVDEFSEYAELTLGRTQMQVVDAEGRDLYKSNAPGWDALVPAIRPSDVDNVATIQTVVRGTEPYRATTLWIDANGQRFRVTLAMSMAAAEDAMRRFGWTLAGLLPGLWLIAAATGFLISRRALRPVDRMTREVQNVSLSRLSQRLDVPEGDDELRRLAVTFNDMLARLEQAIGEITRLTGEASHELRTPVALIRATAEVALSRERPADDYRQALTDVLAHAERMSELVGDLLLLARADAGVETRESGVADLGTVAREATREAGPAAEQRGLQLIAEAEGGQHVPGEPRDFRRLCAILIDNALKYTDAGGVVRVRVGAQDRTVVLDVIDTGIGVPAEERTRVFERFYRGSAARTRADGSGLGLPIARSIVERWHGRIEFLAGPDSAGSIVRVRLPRAEPV